MGLPQRRTPYTHCFSKQWVQLPLFGGATPLLESQPGKVSMLAAKREAKGILDMTKNCGSQRTSLEMDTSSRMRPSHLSLV
jgi:hypothetical protein